MKGIASHCLGIVVALMLAAVTSVQAGIISDGVLDSTTKGNWRTAAPDADLKYGTDGYMMFGYKDALEAVTPPDYTFFKSTYDPARDLTVLPGYVSSYAAPTFKGLDGGTVGAGMAACPQDPTTLAKLATFHIWSDTGPDHWVDLTFTMAQAATFKLGVYLGHEYSEMYPSWQGREDYNVSGSLGGVGHALNVLEPGSEWRIFTVTAAAGEVITVNAISPGGTAAPAISILAFDGGQTVPEPGTVVLLSTSVIGLLAYAWRRRK